MYEESAHSDPEEPLGPLAAKWVADLMNWYEKLQRHFKIDKSDLAKNVRANRYLFMFCEDLDHS